MQWLIAFNQRYWAVITLLLLGAITCLSLWPADSLPAVPGGDKSHHFMAYTALMFPTALRKPKYWPLIGVFFIGWSGVIEVVQSCVNRYGEWLDLAANSAGLIVGLLVAQLVKSFFPDSLD